MVAVSPGLRQVPVGLLALSVTLPQVRRGLRPHSRKLRQVLPIPLPLRLGVLALSRTLRALRSRLPAFRTIPQPEAAIGAGLSKVPYAPQGQPDRALPGSRGLGKPRSDKSLNHQLKTLNS